MKMHSGVVKLGAACLSCVICLMPAEGSPYHDHPEWVVALSLKAVERATGVPLAAEDIRMLTQSEPGFPREYVLSALSPDGKKAFIRTMGEQENEEILWLGSADEDDLQMLLRMPLGIRHPTWSPDAKQIAFVQQHEPFPEWDVDREKGEDIRIFSVVVVDVESGRIREVTQRWWFANTRSVGRIAWSEDGSTIAFGATWTEPPDPNWQDICTVDLSEVPPALRRITSTPARDTAPSFSPDGTRLAYQRYRGALCTDVVVVRLSDLSILAEIGGEREGGPGGPVHEALSPQWLDNETVVFYQRWVGKISRDVTRYTYNLTSRTKSLYETKVKTYDLEHGERELTYRHDPETGEKTLIKTRELGR